MSPGPPYVSAYAYPPAELGQDKQPERQEFESPSPGPRLNEIRNAPHTELPIVGQNTLNGEERERMGFPS